MNYERRCGGTDEEARAVAPIKIVRTNFRKGYRGLYQPGGRTRQH